MKVSKKKTSGLGRRTNYSPAFFNIETVYFSDESIGGDVLYSERAKIIKHKGGVRIKTTSCDGVNYIDIPYKQLAGIVITDPDIAPMPKPEKHGIRSVLMSWTDGLASLHDFNLRIGGSVCFKYKQDNKTQEVTLYHSKQDIFDMFKFTRRYFSKFVWTTPDNEFILNK